MNLCSLKITKGDIVSLGVTFFNIIYFEFRVEISEQVDPFTGRDI